ncbi:hypothetical protein HYQ46_005937 [Verticillium longisporum]|nr:hypothetical protein HYQ46_005937 [Verticillium longisporum]
MAPPDKGKYKCTTGSNAESSSSSTPVVLALIHNYHQLSIQHRRRLQHQQPAFKVNIPHTSSPLRDGPRRTRSTRQDVYRVPAEGQQRIAPSISSWYSVPYLPRIWQRGVGTTRQRMRLLRHPLRVGKSDRNSGRQLMHDRHPWQTPEDGPPGTKFDRYPSAFPIDIFPSPRTDNPGSGSDKKTRLRARNRAAADMYRARKQRGIEDLQAQEAALSAINESLRDKYVKLRGEVLMLRDMVLQHRRCRCSFIEKYGACGSPPFDAQSDNGLYFDWNAAWPGMDFQHDGGQMEGTPTIYTYENY